MTGNRSWIAGAILGCALSMAACGGNANLAQTAPKNPEMALPSDAYLAFGFHPREIVAHPIVAQLRQAVGQEKEDLPFLGLLRDLGLDPQRDIASGVWAMYDFNPASGMNWCMALTGNLDQASVVRAISASAGPEIAPSSRDYLGTKFVALASGQGPQMSGLYMTFPLPGFMVVSNSEPLLKKCIAVWRGKADSLPSSPALGPVYREATAKPAPLWAAGLASKTLKALSISSGYLSRGDSLGGGVQSYHAALQLAADRLEFAGQFHCDNTGSAKKQSQNYLELVGEYAKSRVQTGWGLGPMSLLKQLKLEAQGADLALSFALGAADMTEIGRQFTQARQSMGSRPSLEEILGAARAPLGAGPRGAPGSPPSRAVGPEGVERRQAPPTQGDESLPPPSATPGGGMENPPPTSMPGAALP